MEVARNILNAPINSEIRKLGVSLIKLSTLLKNIIDQPQMIKDDAGHESLNHVAENVTIFVLNYEECQSILFGLEDELQILKR